MKKIYTIGMVVVVIAALIPTLVLAEDVLNNQTVENGEYLEYVDVSPFADIDAELLEAYDEEISSVDDEEYISEDETTDLPDFSDSDECSKKYLKIRGKWGNGKDREFDGYWGGRITLRTNQNGIRVGVFKGLFNKTGDDEKQQLVGIMKKGYFNGKIIKEDGSETKLTGLYKIDRENKLLKMQWMVPHNAGWAIAHVKIVEM